MRSGGFVLGLTVFVLLAPTPARAILIETGKGVRVGGYFVRDDGKKLAIRVRTPDGKEKVNEYDRAKIKVIHQVDRARLQKLTQDDPKGYRDYAEELAGHKADPEARDVAMRLFLIAAYLDPQQFGHGALVSMSALAATPTEARKCRAMAFLLDPQGDAKLLNVDGVKAAARPKAETGALQDFLKALHYYRTGQVKLARDVATRDGMDKLFGMAPGMMDQKAFVQACTDAACPSCSKSKLKGKLVCTTCGGRGIVAGAFGQAERCATCGGQKWIVCGGCDGAGVNQEFPDHSMRMLLRAELWAVDQLAGGDGGPGPGRGETKWSAILQARQVNPVSPLSLETITEFDPRKCLYRNGAWVAP